MKRLGRAAAGLAATVVLSLAASACVTVHGEREVVPSVTEEEAAAALAGFTAAYNEADKAYDPALDAAHVTGALGAINQAGLKARQVNFPDGNPRHVPLELADARFVIPRKAGWPRWFLADTDSNRDTDDGGERDSRWLLAFVRAGVDDTWKAAYLAILAPEDIPAFKRDADGYAEPVTPDDAALAVAPAELSSDYASYLQDGRPEAFTAGPHTTGWRETRARSASLPGVSTQYLDQPLDSGAYAPLGLVTQDGGALVFFTVKNFERQTAAKGVELKVIPDVRALLTGEVRSTLTKERVSGQLVSIPVGSGGGQPDILSRLTGLTAAKGS
ncbi:hypothetical protein [Streptomyces sp. NPDC047968]|uniref:hypothetical protein n=1 Tax=unclassified Streptomyces TaxID=2593676 RepID=UPI0034484BB0